LPALVVVVGEEETTELRVEMAGEDTAGFAEELDGLRVGVGVDDGAVVTGLSGASMQ
jgi:hypothetical protein